MTRPPPPTLAQLGERRAIAVLRRMFDRPNQDLVVGNGDDALVWQPRGQVVATVDSVVQGVDWLPDLTPPEAIGHRAAAVNLSDLAAMGAAPRHLLLAVEAPPDLSAELLVRAARGLATLADRYGCAVAGGDLGLSPGPLRLTVTALGELEGPALLRSAARPGDAVWLIGDVGSAALGLAWLAEERRVPDCDHWAAPFVRAHLWPQPRVAEGLALQRLAQDGQRLGCIDVSDGLALDVGRIASASRLGVVIDMILPPWPTPALHWCADHGLVPSELCGSGGDDYALVVVTHPNLDLAGVLSGSFTVQRIGRCTVGPAGTAFVVIGGAVVAGKGYLHDGHLR